jgi:hypothetical protein
MEHVIAQSTMPRREGAGEPASLSRHTVLIEGERVLFDREAALMPVEVRMEVSRARRRRPR